MLNINILARFKSKLLSLWFFLAAVVIAELLTVYIEPWAGIICHWILLFYCIGQVTFNADIKNRNYLLGLSLVPLIRIISISLPLTTVPQVFWYPLIYLPLFAAAWMVMRTVGLKPSQVGLIKGNLLLQIPAGLVMGFSIGTLEYILLKPLPIINDLSAAEIWFPAIMLLITSGFVEELIFRGLLQNLAVSSMGISGIFYISIVFAVLNLGNYSVPGMMFLFLVAVVLGIFVKRTGSLTGVALAHGTASIVLYTIAPFVLS